MYGLLIYLLVLALWTLKDIVNHTARSVYFYLLKPNVLNFVVNCYFVHVMLKGELYYHTFEFINQLCERYFFLKYLNIFDLRIWFCVIKMIISFIWCRLNLLLIDFINFFQVRNVKILGSKKNSKYSSLCAYLTMETSEAACSLVQGLENFQMSNNLINLKQVFIIFC